MGVIELIQSVHFVSAVWVLLLPIAFIGLDVMTGLTKAFVRKDFQSTKMRSGFGKKIGEIAVLVIGELISYALGLPRVIMSGISLYLVFMELMSNIENLSDLGVPLPKKLIDCLSQVDKAIQTGSSSELTPEMIEEAKRILKLAGELK